MGSAQRHVENLKKAIAMEKKNLDLYKEYAKDAPWKGASLCITILLPRGKKI